MSVDTTTHVDLDDLPMDVFDVTSLGLTQETLTTGHGAAEMSPSSSGWFWFNSSLNPPTCSATCCK